MRAHLPSHNLCPRTVLILLAFCCLATSLAGENEPHGKYYGAKPTEYPAWFKESFLDFEADIAEAKAANKRLMIVYHQDGCPYCNALIERNLSQKDILEKMRKNFDVVALNLWGDREVVSVGGKQYTEKTLAEALKVQFTPTILFFDESGKVILRLNGYLPPSKFSIALDWVAGHKESKMSYRSYIASRTPAGTQGSLRSEDFFSPPPFDIAALLSKSNKPLAVFFEQNDCPNCDSLHTKVLADPTTRKLISEFVNVQLDMWSDSALVTPDGSKTTARNWASKLDIKFAPTIVFFNNKGDEIIRSEAFFKLFHTQGMFAYVLSESYKNQPNFQRYLAARADEFIEQGRDVDIWGYADQKTEKH